MSEHDQPAAGDAIGVSKGEKTFNEYSYNVYSQYGEDGIIAAILQRLEPTVALDGWCAEFGAWDGVHLSNTCRLIRERSYNAVLIEGDPRKVEQLVRNFPGKNVFKVCRFISFEGPDSLDRVLAETPIPSNFDFLSIDVDGVDYHIFDSLKIYRPKIVCIEFNPTIPNMVDFVQAKNLAVKHGSSARALTRLARAKNYALIASTHCNLFFVDGAYAGFVAPHVIHLEDINKMGNDPQYIFVGYDGSILSNKEEVILRWHDLVVPMSAVQFLPESLRKFGADFSALRQISLILFLLLRLPRTGIARLVERVHTAMKRISSTRIGKARLIRRRR